MSQAGKIVLVSIVAALIGGGGVYVWQTNKAPASPLVSIQEQELSPPEVNSESTTTNEFTGAAKYNCKKSGGSFSANNSCVCPIEEGLGQTQEMMYDEKTGYCQTTFGGPGGDAFAASVGLPYGDYAFYNEIVMNNCTETGGEFLYSCNCPNGKVYDESTGYCVE